MSSFKYLFTPKQIGKLWIRNRIVSTGHMTTYVEDGMFTQQLIDYHKERAKGGAGLIIVEANAVHPTAAFTSRTIAAYKDEIIPQYQKLAEAVHQYGAKMFVQLFHPGREVFPSGASMAVSASAVPTDRFLVVPKELEIEEINDIVKGYADTAERVKKGNLDGVEIVASHGYLISQFWSPRTNFRTDGYGGTFENRLRFLREVIYSVREKVGNDFVVGLRLSADDFVKSGATNDEVIEIVKYLNDHVGGLDYLNVTAGSSATLISSIMIVPPSPIIPGHLASLAGRIKEAVSIPVISNGRLNDPVMAEKILASGVMDMVGMTRAMICDPHMPNKAMREEFDKIRFCIGCNQACIGHMHHDLPIGCIQNPITGREGEYAMMSSANQIKQVIVIGGGPAGMKAAVIAAQRGHKVTLFEKSDELGGLVKTARNIPTREEFGELISNLKRELAYFRVDVRLNTDVDKEMILAMQADEVIIATGATPLYPDVQGIHLPHVITAEDVLNRKKEAGANVVIADWKGDMPGVGAALYLGEPRRKVELFTTCYHVGYTLQQYVRDTILTQLYLKQVALTAHYKLHEITPSSVTFENIYTGQLLTRDGIDSVVLATGYKQNVDLYNKLKGFVPNLHRIGDCVSPRTAEEAILEGFELGAKI